VLDILKILAGMTVDSKPNITTAKQPITTTAPITTERETFTVQTNPVLKTGIEYKANFTSKWNYYSGNPGENPLVLIKNADEFAEKLSFIPDYINFTWHDEWNYCTLVTYTFWAGIGGSAKVNEAVLKKEGSRWLIDHKWEYNDTVRGEPEMQMMYFVIPHEAYYADFINCQIAYGINGIVEADAVISRKDARETAEAFGKAEFGYVFNSVISGEQVKYNSSVAYKFEGRFYDFPNSVYTKYQAFIYVDVMTGEVLGSEKFEID
jgi:hypothetical protein